MNLQELPSFPGWRPLRSDEFITEGIDVLVCVNIHSSSYISYSDPDSAYKVTKSSSWGSRKVEEAFMGGLNTAFYPYRKANAGRLPMNPYYSQPLPLP